MTPGTQFGHTFLSGISSLFCGVNVTSIDLPPNIIFTWWGPQGQVTDDEKYDLNEGLAADGIQVKLNKEDYTHYSNLVIRDLALMDNETQYYCIVQVGVNNTFDQLAYVIPGATISENITVLVEGIHVCVYVCKCVCIYVCIYYIHVYMYVCIYVCMYVCTCIYACTYVFMYFCDFVCIYVCIYVRMYLRMYVYMYIRICVRMYAYMYVIMNVCIFM